MANEQKITEIWDIAALEAQKAKVIDMMKQTVSEMEKANAVKISFNGDAKTIGEATKITSEYNKQYENTIRLTGQLNNLKSTEGQIEEQLQQAQKESIKNQKLQAQATNDQAGAFSRLKAEAALATNNYRNLAAQYGKNSIQAREAGKEAANLNAKVSDINKNAGIANNNVGKYSEGITSAMKKIGAAIVAAFAFDKIVGFFKSGLDMSIKWEERNARMLFTLNGNTEAFDRMSAKAAELSKTSLFKKSDIADAQILALQLGRSEEQTNKMITAAMGLARVTGVDLSAAMQTMSMTLEGSKGRLGRIVGEVKHMSEEELKAGKAIDIVNERFGKFGKEGLETTGGKLIMLSKEFDGFKRKLVEGTGGKGAFDGLVEGVKSLVGWLNKNVTVVGKIIVEVARFLTVIVAWKVGTMAAAAAQTVWTAATNLYATVANRAKTATIALNAAQKSNIWGLIASAVALAVTYLVQYISKTKEATKAQSIYEEGLQKLVDSENELKDARNSITSNTERELQSAKILFDVLRNTNASRTDHKKAINEVNSVYGKFLGYLLTEKSSLVDINTAYNAIAQQLIRNREIKLANTKLDDAFNKKEIARIALEELQTEQSRKRVEYESLKRKYEKQTIGGKDVDKEYIKGLMDKAKADKDYTDGLVDSQLKIYNSYSTLVDIRAKEVAMMGTEIQVTSAATTETDKDAKAKDKNTKATIKYAEGIERVQKILPKQVDATVTYYEKLQELNKQLQTGLITQKEYNQSYYELNGVYIDAIDNTEKLTKAQMDLNNEIRAAKSTELNKLYEEIPKLAGEGLGLIQSYSDLMSVNNDNELKEYEKLQDEKLRVLNERLNLGLITEAQYTAQKSNLDLEYDKKKEELEKKEFKRKKALAIAEAVINAASGVIKALGEGSILGIIQAGVIGAMAALEIAKINAQYPTYAKGRTGGKEEVAIVGEGPGWEYISTKDGLFKTPNTATLTQLPAGASVIPHNISVQLEKYIGTGVVSGTNKTQTPENRDILNELKKLNSKPTAVVNMNKHGIRTALAQGNSFMIYVNNNLTMKR